MKMEFTKMHGTGNDYVYVNCMEQEEVQNIKVNCHLSLRLVIQTVRN